MRLTLHTRNAMKITRTALLAGGLVVAAGCQNFLDVNKNPNGPDNVTANLYLPPMLHWLVSDAQWDGRFLGRYVQNWFLPVSGGFSTWDQMGFDPGSDNGAQTWRDVYWSVGQSLIDMNTKAEAEQRWDLLEIGRAHV